MKVSRALQVAVGVEPFQETKSQEQQSRNNSCLQHLILMGFLFWSFYGKILMHKHLPQPPCLLSAFPKLGKLHSHRVWRGGAADKPLALIFTVLTQSWPAPSEAVTATTPPPGKMWPTWFCKSADQQWAGVSSSVANGSRSWQGLGMPSWERLERGPRHHSFFSTGICTSWGAAVCSSMSPQTVMARPTHHSGVHVSPKSNFPRIAWRKRDTKLCWAELPQSLLCCQSCEDFGERQPWKKTGRGNSFWDDQQEWLLKVMLEVTNSTTSLGAQPYCGPKAGSGSSGAKSPTDWPFTVDYWTPPRAVCQLEHRNKVDCCQEWKARGKNLRVKDAPAVTGGDASSHPARVTLACHE